MGETSHLWETLQRAYVGNAWHGPGLRPLLRQVGAEAAAAHPIRGAHSIWEVACHMCLLEDRARRHLEGECLAPLQPGESWLIVTDDGAEAWAHTLDCFDCFHTALGNVLGRFPEEKLTEVVPGRDYPYYMLMHGLAQHELFHAGQITVIMQAQSLAPVG